MEYTQQAKLTSKIKMIMNFLNQFHKSKINKIKKKKFDADFNSKQDEIKFDSKGFFLIDSQSKPPRPLAEGIPLSYETKEKEIDLSDKG